MSTYSWPEQRYRAQTVCEKLCDCVSCLGWDSEFHLREQNNWLLVPVQRLLWVFCYTSLWPFLKLTAFSSFAWNPNGFSKTAVKVDQFVPICSIEVNSSPVSPGYWPSQQEPPANPYTESKWESGREEGGWSGTERESEPISEEKWASAEKTWSATKEIQRGTSS